MDDVQHARNVHGCFEIYCVCVVVGPRQRRGVSDDSSFALESKSVVGITPLRNVCSIGCGILIPDPMPEHAQQAGL
eukprot:9390545-Alexandrium_andersonii.AAC.1